MKRPGPKLHLPTLMQLLQELPNHCWVWTSIYACYIRALVKSSRALEEEMKNFSTHLLMVVVKLASATSDCLFQNNKWHESCLDVVCLSVSPERMSWGVCCLSFLILSTTQEL